MPNNSRPGRRRFQASDSTHVWRGWRGLSTMNTLELPLCRTGDGFEVGADLFVGGVEGEDGGVGFDVPGFAGVAVGVGPPVAMLGEALVAPLDRKSTRLNSS